MLVLASLTNDRRVFAEIDPYAVVVADGLSVEDLPHVYCCFGGGVRDDYAAEGAEG